MEVPKNRPNHATELAASRGAADLPTTQFEGTQRTITRRRLVELGAQAGLLLGAGGIVSACGGSSSSSTARSALTVPGSAAPGGTPVTGGTFTLGVITGGSSETINPGLAGNYPDIARVFQLYDPLFEIGPDLQMVPRLATAAEPNKTATLWTLQLRPGVTWHDGKSFTAADVVYTIRGWQSPTNLGGAILTGLIDWSGVRQRGPLTVEVPLTVPVAEFPTLLGIYNNMMVQDGATTTELNTAPVGTGPFRFVSFQPGQNSVFDANHDYWEHPKPYVDRVVVDSSFTDETARLNALLSGAINVLPIIPPIEAREQMSSTSVRVLRAQSSGVIDFVMRVDAPPFDDVRVRTAVKLLANRQALIDGAISGFGQIGNDLLGKGAPYYNGSLHRPYDPEQAKFLLKAAGQENLSFTLPIAPAGPGFIESATLLAAQAQAVGVTIDIKQIPAANYFSYTAGYLKRPIQASTAFPPPSLTAAFRGYTSQGAPYNETSWGSQPGAASADKLLAAAIAALDPAKAKELWAEVELQQFDEGGYLIWTYADNLDAVATDIRGLTTSNPAPLNNYRLLDGWIAS